MIDDMEEERIYLDGGSAMSTYEPPEEMADMPPGTKLTYKVLEWEGELTQKELVEETMLAHRTVRAALERLKEEDIVSEGVYIQDARQRIYSIEGGDNDVSGELKSVEER